MFLEEIDSKTEWRSKAPSPGIDRRASRRYPLRLKCSFQVFVGKHLLAIGRATTTNISSCGVLLKTGDITTVGANIELWVALPSETPVTVHMLGRIVRVNGSGVAVEAR